MILDIIEPLPTDHILR